jgi:hypothetical protein
MHKSATKCNETICKWCKNKHGASKIIDTLETYHSSPRTINLGFLTEEKTLLLYSSYLPLRVPNGLVIYHASVRGLDADAAAAHREPSSKGFASVGGRLWSRGVGARRGGEQRWPDVDEE